MRRPVVTDRLGLKLAMCAPLIALAISGCGKSPEQLAAERAAEELRAIEVQQEPLKLIVRQQLKDPDSAQFRSLSIVQGEGGLALCGEVNAKNSYGGYNGYSEFVAATNPLPNSKERVVFVKEGHEQYLAVVDIIASGCSTWWSSRHKISQCPNEAASSEKMCLTGHPEYVRK